MNEQPEALRLADLIEWTTVKQDLSDAADELRRLHAEAEHWCEYAGERCDDIWALTNELKALKAAIAREIDHAEINRIRTEPPFGKPKGEVCVPVRSLLAILERKGGQQ